MQNKRPIRIYNGRENPIYNSKRENKILLHKYIKNVQNIYKENYKAPLKVPQIDLNIQKDITCSWIEKLKIKMSILPVLIYKSNPISRKIPLIFPSRGDMS